MALYKCALVDASKDLSITGTVIMGFIRADMYVLIFTTEIVTWHTAD